MMAGFTSPAREWFRLGVGDQKLEKNSRVKQWLFDVEEAVRVAMLRSNFYKAMPQCYLDLLAFGSHCSFIDENEETHFRFYPQLVGSYCLASGVDGKVDTIFRDISYTVAQVVEKFGVDNVSAEVLNKYKAGRQQDWVDVCHAVEPNREQVSDRVDFKGMKYISHWFETANNAEIKQGEAKTNDGKFLSRNGYREFPAICPRWFVSGEDVYGSSPGMDGLGDCRMLQLLERRKMQAFDKIVQPPMVGDPSLRGQRTSLLPADITYATGVDKGFKPVFMINASALTEFREEIRSVIQRIDETFHKDLWVAFLQDEKIQPRTAEEIIRKHEEKLLQLGPVMENIADEALGPGIERIISIMFRRGALPPPPPEIQMYSGGIDIEYMNIASVAQKMQGVSSIERLSGFAANMASVNPEALDVINVDEVIYTYADMQGVKPSLLRSPEEVAQIRQQRAQKQQAAEQGAAMATAAKGVKDVGTAGDAGQSLLAQILPNLAKSTPGGVASPTPPVMSPPGIA